MSSLKSIRKSNRAGFTLLELLIVIGILAILTGIVISAFQTFNRGEGVNKDTETVLSVLRLAQDQTRASKNENQYGVYFASSSVVLFAGTSYSAGASGNVVYPLHSSDTVLSTNLFGGAGSVVFQRLTGATADYGTVTLLSLAASSSDNVTIYATGLVQGPPSI